MRKIAISDIHGCLKSFKALLYKIVYSKRDELYLLGDFIDRGPDSKGLIDYIWQLQYEGHFIHCLRGNHEQMLLDSFNDPSDLELWQIHGGLDTMKSFGTESLEEIDEEYLRWIDNLPYFAEVDEYILVHAGLDFDVPNPFDSIHSMIWIRNWYNKIKKDWLGDRIIVHGHTPTNASAIRENLSKIDERSTMVIDGGCVYDRFDLGYLFAFDLDKRQLYAQKNIEAFTI